MSQDIILCACGCGQSVPEPKFPSQQRQYINFHQHRGSHNGNYKGKVTITCAICGEQFDVIPALAESRKTCGKDECYRQWQRLTTKARGRNKVEIKCARCGKTVKRWPSQLKNRTHVYCSRKCQNDGHGENVSDDKHWKWDGGDSRWIRTKVLERDDGKCLVCGFAIVLDIHHVIPKSNGGSDDFDNLITLCPNHHRMADLGIINVEHLRVMNWHPLASKEDT